MRIASLFSGIGGLELPGHRRRWETRVFCDVWEPAQKVLSAHFPDVAIHGDIRTLEALPDVDMVTAGFPCTDLSQAGRTAGIAGSESGLVENVFRLLENATIEWLVLENVRNMLFLDRGQAMRYLVHELERLGFRWAYRLVDSRFSGVPQRRQRVLFVASRHHDPGEVLFADESQGVRDEDLATDTFGFYWTEGLRGLGWAPDAVPPLKGGSNLGIPSPPAVWVPGAEPGRRIGTPSIGDAEALQGFERGWTSPADDGPGNSPRWKLVGNAVTVGVADWLAGRLENPGPRTVEPQAIATVEKWPTAAEGHGGKAWKVDASMWPIRRDYAHLSDVVNVETLKPLSYRATAGFLGRAERSTLRFNEEFLVDVKEHVELMRPG